MFDHASLGSGAAGKGVLQLEATFTEVKNMYLHQDSNPNTAPSEHELFSDGAQTYIHTFVSQTNTYIALQPHGRKNL